MKYPLLRTMSRVNCDWWRLKWGILEWSHILSGALWWAQIQRGVGPIHFLHGFIPFASRLTTRQHRGYESILKYHLFFFSLSLNFLSGDLLMVESNIADAFPIKPKKKLVLTKVLIGKSGCQEQALAPIIGDCSQLHG